jgi:hypothetical protein
MNVTPIEHAWALRLRGLSRTRAATIAGIDKKTKAMRYTPRSEAAIRADLARQLEGIVMRWEASL